MSTSPSVVQTKVRWSIKRLCLVNRRLPWTVVRNRPEKRPENYFNDAKVKYVTNSEWERHWMLKDLRLTRRKKRRKRKEKKKRGKGVCVFCFVFLLFVCLFFCVCFWGEGLWRAFGTLLEFLDLFWTIGFRPDKTHLAESMQSFWPPLSLSLSVT